MLPKSICLYLTSKCYLSCNHCFLVENETLNKFTLRYETIISILDDAKKGNVFMIPLTGGDPLLHPDCFKIVNEIKKRNMMPLLGISGVQVNKDIANMIKKSNIPSVQLSLDGHNEQINSRYRGPGVFQQVVETIKLLNKKRINVNVSFVADKNNFKYIDDFLELCLTLSAFKVKIAPRTPIPAKKEELKSVILDMNEIKFLNERCEQFQLDNGLTNWIMIPDFYPAEKVSSIDQINALIVFANGDVHLDEYEKPIGNVNGNLLSEIFENYLKQEGIS